MTIEELIAQLEAMRETLLPLETAAWDAQVPVRAHWRELRTVHVSITNQIAVINAALEAFGVPHEPTKRDY